MSLSVRITYEQAINNIINLLYAEKAKEEKESGRWGMYYTVELYEQVLKMIETELEDVNQQESLEAIKIEFCDSFCRVPYDAADQEEADELCKLCPLKKLEVIL